MADIRGEVLEAGVGTGRNLGCYHPSVNLTCIDLISAMLKRAMKRAGNARCRVNLVQEYACRMESIPSNHYDWIVATFLCCVIPEELQHLAIEEFVRILKLGGRFRLLEMVYSKNPALKKRQNFFAPFVEKVYGARFDRNTLKYVRDNPRLKVCHTRFVKRDVYLLIEGVREN